MSEKDFLITESTLADSPQITTSRYSPWQTFTILVVLSFSMASMGSAIVMESTSFPLNQWLLTTLYIATFDLLFLLTLLFYYRLSLRHVWSELKQWREYALIGLLWSMNYIFILLSAPYVPNVIQVVLAQMQSVLIAIIDWKFVGIILTKEKVVCICSGVAFGIASVAVEVQTSEEPKKEVVFWAIVFAANSIASGLASLSTETLLKVKRRRFEKQMRTNVNKHDGDGSYAEETEQPTFRSVEEVVMLNFCANCYGILCCLLGLPIAAYSLSYPANNAPAASLFNLIDVRIFAQPKILFWVLMVVASYVYTITSGVIALDQSAIYNAMASAFGGTLQLCFFYLPGLGQFHTAFKPLPFGLALGVVLSSLVYLREPDKRNFDKMEASILGKYYTSALEGHNQKWIVLLAVLSVYLVFYVWSGVLWATS